ncbi:MAG: hypothetical protein WKF84_28170 [Pyrinomonadaceae bacterium]
MITAREISAVVSQYLTGYYLSQETNAAQAGGASHTYELIEGGGWKNAFQYMNRLRASTPADVQRVANTYMRNMRFVVLGDAASVDKNIFTTQAIN